MKIYLYLFVVVFSCSSYSKSLSIEQVKTDIDFVISIKSKSLNDTMVIKNIIKELYVCTCKPDTNNPSGNGEIYYQGKWEVNSVSNDVDKHLCDERFLMQWDLSELPKGIKIIEAKLRLVCAEFNGDKQGQLVYECISEPWSADFGYNKKPNTLPESRVVTGWPKKNSYHYVDITDFVKWWYHDSIPNYGLMGLSVDTETNNSAIFCSSKFPKESVRPKLIVIFQENN